MTTAAEWVQGARPRTLGAAVSPVLVGTAAAYAEPVVATKPKKTSTISSPRPR